RLDEVDIHDPLIIGENSNIQDCAVVHSTTTKIGSRVIVAHQAVVHGAVLEDDVTVYIQATVDGNGTVIGKGSFLHQGSYVGKGVNVPENSYVAPGQKVMCQEQADALPPVPESLKRIHENVMAHNREHCVNHLALKHLNQ
ncbi:hypothetical protein KKF84_02560, partial [Myxococcota bacterium]|nr:hypothetical protein [Myxococcota bacterium]MBU1534171.1 hypothetical protein [Myxococcota bacterium]